MQYQQPQAGPFRLNPKYRTRFAFNPASISPNAIYTNTSKSIIKDGISQVFNGGGPNNSYINNGVGELTNHFNTTTPAWGMLVIDFTVASGDIGIISKEELSIGGGWDVVIGNGAGNATIHFRLINTGANSVVSSTVGAITTGRHVIIFTYNGKIITSGSQKLYIDGVDVESGTSSAGSGSNASDATKSLYIGQIDPAWVWSCLTGKIILSAFGWGTLTANQIKQLSNNPFDIYSPTPQIMKATVAGGGDVSTNKFKISLGLGLNLGSI